MMHGYIFRHASVSSTHPAKTGITVVLRRITVVLHHFFSSGFPFCHCLWALTKCRHDIVVATITKEVSTITKKVSHITKKVTTITKEVATISKEVVTITNELTTITKEVATITKLFWVKVYFKPQLLKGSNSSRSLPRLACLLLKFRVQTFFRHARVSITYPCLSVRR